MTNKQFARKVFRDAPMEFLVGERGMELEELENLFGEQLYNLILTESKDLTKEEQEDFMFWNCGKYKDSESI